MLLGWLREAARILANREEEPGELVQARYQTLLDRMAAERETAGTLAPAVDHLVKVSTSYAPGLFHTYDVAGVPRTNNDLVPWFGRAR